MNGVKGRGTRMNRERSDEATPDPTAEHVAGFVSAQVRSPPQARKGEKEFLRRLQGARQVRRNVKWFTLGATLASALAVAGLVVSRFKDRAPDAVALRYQVDNRDPPSDGNILVPQAT